EPTSSRPKPRPGAPTRARSPSPGPERSSTSTDDPKGQDQPAPCRAATSRLAAERLDLGVGVRPAHPVVAGDPLRRAVVDQHDVEVLRRPDGDDPELVVDLGGGETELPADRVEIRLRRVQLQREHDLAHRLTISRELRSTV